MGAQVAKQAVDAAIGLARAKGLDVGPLTAGLASYHGNAQVDWDEYCEILNRLVETVGGPSELERLVEEGYHLGYPQVTAIAQRLVAPTFLLYAGASMVGRLFPVDFQLNEVDDGLFHWRIVLKPEATRGSFWLFFGNVATARGVSRHLDLPPCTVDASFDDRSGDYWVRLPPSPALPSRVLAAGRALVRRFMPDSSAESIIPPQRLDRAALATVRSIGEKLANCADTESLLNTALEEVRQLVGGDEVTLWHRPNNGPRLERVGVKGIASQRTSMMVYALRLAGNEFGRIDVRGGNRSELLSALVPWLSMSLAHAISERPSRTQTLGDRLEETRRRFGLTARQQSVLERAANGLSNKEIAADLGLSIKTVEFHLAQLFARTGAQNRAQLAKLLFSVR